MRIKDMRFLYLMASLLFLVNAKGVIGNENGGGGSECKSDFSKRVFELERAVKINTPMLKRFPFLNYVFDTFNPNKNPGFKIEVMTTKIQDCPMSADPIACANPSKNLIRLYCAQDGWLSLSANERDRQVLHELMWWLKDFDDSNYFYSRQIVEELHNVFGDCYQYAGMYSCSDGTSLELSIDEFNGSPLLSMTRDPIWLPKVLKLNGQKEHYNISEHCTTGHGDLCRNEFYKASCLGPKINVDYNFDYYNFSNKVPKYKVVGQYSVTKAESGRLLIENNSDWANQLSSSENEHFSSSEVCSPL